MNKQLKQVREFNKAFNLPLNDSPTVGEYDDRFLRYRLMEEENDEYHEASIISLKNEEKGLIGIADALTDELYILLGKFHYHGLADRLEELFDEVHESNMSKLDDDGKPIYREDGKVLKSVNYFKPQLRNIVLGCTCVTSAQKKVCDKCEYGEKFLTSK